ncbi:hypothetical protein OROHE_005445 [Orobanche hederae]
MASGSQSSKDNPQKCLQKKKRASKNLTKKNAKNASAVWQHFGKQRHNIVVRNENGEDVIVGHEMKAHYPRFKLRYFERVIGRMLGYDDAAVKTRSGNLKELIIKLTDLYAPSISSQCSNTKNESIESDIGSSNRYSSTKISGKKALMIEDWEKDLEDDTIVISHEVDRYLLDPIEKRNSDFDILKWWRLNGSKYPNLQLVAKDVLAIQVSTVASESCFSTGKRVIDPHRSSLTPRSVEALICLQNWLKSVSVTNLEYTPTPEEIEFIENTEKELDEEEKAEREEVEKIEKEKEKAIVDKKNKVAKTSKNAYAGIASRMIIN